MSPQGIVMANARLVLLSVHADANERARQGRQNGGWAHAGRWAPLPDWSGGEFWQQDVRYE